MERMEAIEKLVDEFHLNVEERKIFIFSPLLQEEVIAEIANIVSQKGSYPSSWKSETDYEGAYLEAHEEIYVATYNAEESLMRYSIVEVREFEERSDAAKYAMERMFGDEIDGIEIK